MSLVNKGMNILYFIFQFVHLQVIRSMLMKVLNYLLLAKAELKVLQIGSIVSDNSQKLLILVKCFYFMKIYLLSRSSILYIILSKKKYLRNFFDLKSWGSELDKKVMELKEMNKLITLGNNEKYMETAKLLYREISSHYDRILNINLNDVDARSSWL